jgi:hypothetical protein
MGPSVRWRTETACGAGTALAAEQRYQRIAEAAYRRAEARDFAPGGEIEDWLAAEGEVDSDVASEP